MQFHCEFAVHYTTWIQISCNTLWRQIQPPDDEGNYLTTSSDLFSCRQLNAEAEFTGSSRSDCQTNLLEKPIRSGYKVWCLTT